MSQSLIEERQSRILAITQTGFPIYALTGAEPGEEENEGGDGNKEGEKEGEGQSGTESGSSAGAIVSPEEFAALQAKLRAADQNRSKLQQRLDEIDNANKSELEKAQADLAKATERAEKAERDAHEAKIGREFLKFPGYDWHDPETALALVDLSSLEIEEDGKVKGMKEAVEKLAKAKPFLLKSKKEEAPGGGTPGTPSGHSPGGRPNVKQEQREALVKKYKL